MTSDAIGGPVRECGLTAPAVKPMKTAPSGRYSDGPVHRLDIGRRLATAAPSSTNRIPALSGRPLQPACDSDAVGPGGD